MTLDNEIILAAAGSGKTHRLITEALANPSERVLITTYTRENLAQIQARLWDASNGCMDGISTMTWFEFLLRHAVKPYQSYMTSILRIKSINFIQEKPRFSEKSDFDSYYLDSSGNVYSETVSDLACALEQASDGSVIHRLEQLYDIILIDEMQDLTGWDLEFVELLLRSRLRVVLVGDPRQAVYSTNRSNKNRAFRNMGIVKWIDRLERAGLCVRSTMPQSYRCNQEICSFADALFPELPRTQSVCNRTSRASGVYFVLASDAPMYRRIYHPQALRWDRRSKKAGPDALNFGDVKGREFPRVLIYPTRPMLKYLEGGELLSGIALTKFYVAVTRASVSVAILVDKVLSNTSLTVWKPDQADQSS